MVLLTNFTMHSDKYRCHDSKTTGRRAVSGVMVGPFSKCNLKLESFMKSSSVYTEAFKLLNELLNSNFSSRPAFDLSV